MKIRNLILTLFGALSLVVIYGCPYESEVPISEPTVEVKDNLLGKWVNDSTYKDGDEISRYYEITKFTGNEFKATEFSEGEKKSYYIGHFSDVEGEQFLNLIDPSNMAYKLYRVRESSDKLMILDPLSDYIKESFSSSEELKNFILKNKNLSFFYGPAEYFVKAINPIFKSKNTEPE